MLKVIKKENYIDDTGYEPSYDELLPDLESNEEMLAKEKAHLKELKIARREALRAHRMYEVDTLDRKILDTYKRIDYIKELIAKVVTEDYEEFDDPEEPEQEFDSAETSINQVPALFKWDDYFIPGDINLDIGGGKYDTATEYLKNVRGSTNLVYDPKNRSAEHNKEVIEIVKANGGADSVTCANVLNVIKEPEVRLAIIRNCYKYLKSGHKAYFITYEDDGKSDEGPTTKGYQLRKKTTFYKNEIEQVFNKVEITNSNKLIIATK